MPSRPSSHAVSRAPCSSGRVSLATTPPSAPRRCSSATTPSAVPPVTAASAPVLQWVSSRGPRPAQLGDQVGAAAWPSPPRPRSPRRAARSASASTASGPSGSRAAARRAPRARLTAVGRAVSTRRTASAGRRTVAVRPGGQRHPERPGDAERRRAAHGQPFDRRDQLVHRGQPQHVDSRRQRRLVDDLDGAVHPVDRPHRLEPTAVAGVMTARDPVADLRRIAFLLERANEATYRVRAFRSAADALSALPTPARSPTRAADGHAHQARAASATSPPGAWSSRCAGEEPVYLRRLRATEGTDSTRPRRRCGPRCAATATPTPTGPTAARRSRRWRSRRSSSGTSTSC